MKTRLICPLLKSPISVAREGWLMYRRGTPEKSDWYRSLVMAAKLFRESEAEMTHVMVASENTFGGRAETEIYVEELMKLGVPPENIRVLHEGRETIGQMAAVMRYCAPLTDEAVFVCSWLHCPRVWWLQRDHSSKNVEIVAVNGQPRPKEALTDVVLAVAFPILDMIGLRGWFLRKTEARRVAEVL